MTDPADASSDPTDKAAALRAELERLVARARTAAAEAGISGEDLVERSRAAAEATDAYVHKSPIASAAIAFLAGCLIGRLTR
jgi:ElaB/YqjD/DUF883 family membrane-anchored ribosome-binding protein